MKTYKNSVIANPDTTRAASGQPAGLFAFILAATVALAIPTKLHAESIATDTTKYAVNVTGGQDSGRAENTNVDYSIDDGITLTIVAAASRTSNDNGVVYNANEGNHTYTVIASGPLKTGRVVFQGYEGGYVHASTSNGRYGGAFFLGTGNATVTIANAIFQNYNLRANATAQGGVIYMNTGNHTVSLTDVYFANNSGTASRDGSVTARGGVIYVDGTNNTNTLLLNSATFINNSIMATIPNTTSTNNATAQGGAIYMIGTFSSATINGGIFQGNITEGTAGSSSAGRGFGGAIYMDTNSTLLMNDGTFLRNRANAYGNTGTALGGAVAVITGTATFNDVIFEKNSVTVKATSRATARGGAVYMENNAIVSMTNVVFTSNTALGATTNSTTGAGYGGAVYIDSGLMTIEGGTFSSNMVHADTVDGRANAYGGAVYIENNTIVSMANVVFTSNTALGANVNSTTGSGYGGAIYIDSGLMTIESGTFSGNVAHADTASVRANAYGGAVFMESGTLSLNNVVFDQNNAHSTSSSSSGYAQGGAIHISSGSLENALFQVTGGIFSNNWVSGSLGDTSRSQNYNGGAVYQTNTMARSEFTDVIFVSNTTRENGGAFYLSSAVTTQTNVVYKDNIATEGRGGAVYIVNAAPEQSTFTGGTFQGNISMGNDGGGIYVSTQANIMLTNFTFQNNISTQRGGAIAMQDSSTITINGGAFVNNKTDTYDSKTGTGYGGAFFVGSANTSLVLNDVEMIAGNTAKGRTGRGGAFYINDATVTINVTAQDVAYTDNKAYGSNSSGDDLASAEATTGGFAYLNNDNAKLVLNITTGRTLTIGDASDVNADTIASNGNAQSLIINGADGNKGNVILHGDSSNFSATTNLNAGSLLLGNTDAKLGGTIIVSSTAAFGGLGSATSFVDLRIANSTIIIGMDHATNTTISSTFTIGGTLALSSGGNIFQFDLIGNGVNDQLFINEFDASDFSSGAHTIDLNTTLSGTYTLIRALNGDTFESGVDFITTKNGELLTGRISAIYSLANGDTDLVLVLDKTNYLRTWNSIGGTWDGAAENWAGTGDDLFLDGDRAKFTDAYSGIVTVGNAGVTTADITVDTASTYTFIGGVIKTDTTSVGTAASGDDLETNVATGKLVKTGAGTLILNNTGANSFQAGIFVTAGTIQGNVATLGTPVGIDLAANTTVVFDQADVGIYSSTITGAGGFAKTNTGTLTLDVAATAYTGTTRVENGQLTLTSADQLINSSAINLAGGMLDTASFNQTFASLTGSGTIATGVAASTLTLNAAATASSTFGGVISGNAAVEKTGGSTLTLTGNNTHTGLTTITDGTLALGDGTTDSGNVAGAIDINTAAALLVNHGTFNTTLASAITGGGILTKIGDGSLTLTADNSAYAGIATVSAGTLLVGPDAQLDGSVVVNSAATFGGSGTANNVTISDGGALVVGLSHGVAYTAESLESLSILGTLDLANNTTLKFDTCKDSSGDTSSELLNVANLVRTGTTYFDISTALTGTYTLLASAGDLGAIMGTGTMITKVKGEGLSVRSNAKYQLTPDNNALELIINTSNLSIVWSGSNGFDWVGGNANWLGSDDQFVDGDKVTFDNSAQAGSNTINIVSAVMISDMIVDGAGDYIFTGGAITTTTNATNLTPAAKLVKTGGGKLTFSNAASTFLNGIEINGGTVEGNTDTLAVGSDTGILNNAALVFNQTDDATYASAITGGGSLAKTGAGALTLDNAANTYAGGISVDAGSLTLLNSGTSTHSSVHVESDALLAINGGAAYNVTHALTGPGIFAIDLASAGSVLTLDPAMGNSFSGTLALGRSVFTLSGDALAGAALRLGAGNTTTVATGTHALAALIIDDGKLIFDVTAPADKTSSACITVTDLDISHGGSVQATIPAGVPATLPDTNRDILEQDDIADGIRLVGATGSVTGDGSNLQLRDQSDNPVDQTTAYTVTITKSASDSTKVADAEYQYKLGANDARDGLYLGYALGRLTVADEQTLEIVAAADAGEAASTLSAIVEGAGSLLLNGAAGHNGTLVINGSNSYGGATEVTGGIVKAGSNDAFGNTASLNVAAGATVDLNGKTQTIGTLANQGMIALGAGALTIRSGGSSTGSLSGAAGSAINFQSGNVTIAGANAGLHAAVQLASGATVSIDDAQGLGDGKITFDAGSTLAIAGGGTLANTLASSSAYAGTLVKSGTGMLLVTSNNTAFSGRVEVEDGGIDIVGNASLGTATLDLARASNVRIVYNGISSGSLGANIIGRGTLVLTDGSHMTMDRDLDAFALELHNSTINIAHTLNDSETFNVFRVGSLVGTGTINMSVNFGRAKYDQLLIGSAADASAEDHFFLAVTPVSNRRSNQDTLIPLIVGAAPSAQFELVGGSVSPDGVNTFTLWQGGQNQNISDPGTWYLAASPQLTKVGDAIINTTSMMGADWHYELESLNKRMGDVRRSVFAESARTGGNVWISGHGYHINASSLTAGGYKFEQDVYGVTLGADKLFHVGRSVVLLGIFGGMTNINRDFVNHGDGSSDIANGGVYATWLYQGGFYADIALKYDSYGHEFTSRGDDIETARGDYDTKGFGGAIELGYLIQAGGGWWCEPSVQFAYAKLKGADYTTDSDLAVSVDDAVAQQYRAMVRWGKTFGASLNIYVKAALVKSASSDGEIVINEVMPRRAEFDGVRTEFGIGTTHMISKRSQIWIDYEYAKAENYTKPWSFNAGYRLLW
jgi:outer membrane autotransporter protein